MKVLYQSQELWDIVESGVAETTNVANPTPTATLRIEGESQEGQEGIIFHLPSSGCGHIQENLNGDFDEESMGYTSFFIQGR